MKNLIGIELLVTMTAGMLFSVEPKTTDIETVEEIAIEEVKEPVRYLTRDDLSLLYSYRPEKRESDVYDFTQSEAMLLMKIARAEAGSEMLPQMWVMRTIINRMESDNADFGDLCTIGQVVTQTRQFQVVTKKTFEKVELNENSHLALAEIEKGWDGTSGALYFKASSDKTTWHDKNLTFICEIAGQRYYK